jgi:hypothetical protein
LRPDSLTPRPSGVSSERPGERADNDRDRARRVRAQP